MDIAGARYAPDQASVKLAPAMHPGTLCLRWSAQEASMRFVRFTALMALLLAGCTSQGSNISPKDPVDCVFNGPCTGAPTHTVPR